MAAESASPEFQLAFAQLEGQLACPACHGRLRLDGGRIACVQCGRRYPIVDGIPVLIAGQAR